MTRQHRTGLALLIACAVFSAGVQAKGDASKLGATGTPLTPVGAEANYLNKFTFDLSYTDYWGASDLNLINDRDFVAFVVKYSF